MIVGIPPFYSNNRRELFSNIVSGPLRIPKSMSLVARNFILALLDRNPKKRLGAGPTDATELKEHEFFEGIDWDKLARKGYEMPKIQVKSSVPQKPEALFEFKRSEKESEKKMQELLKKIKKEG